MRLLTVLTLSIAMTAAAQSPQDVAKAFQSAVEHRTLYLRGYPGGEKVHWSWNGSELALAPQPFHALTALEVSSVKIKPGHVEVKGQPRILTVDKKGKPNLMESQWRPIVTVDFPVAMVDELLPKLFDVLFFATMQDAVLNVPPAVRGSLPEALRSPSPSSKKTCDCETSVCVVDLADPVKLQHQKPPRLLSAVDPEFSEEARRNKFSGNVQVSFTVDEKGHTRDLWITHPVGLGLDQKAINAASQYRFAPASCHGEPIAVSMNVEVNFQIF